MNPAGFSETGTALARHLDTLTIPYFEVHLTNLETRGLQSLMASKARGLVMGFGIYSYIAAIEAILLLFNSEDSPRILQLPS
jgi:3-dehydroquinate dehydratase-2